VGVKAYSIIPSCCGLQRKDLIDGKFSKPEEDAEIGRHRDRERDIKYSVLRPQFSAST
jgi:hypothetical protein